MIQFNISSSFSSSQIYLFITPLLSHLSHIRGQGNMQNFPQCCIVKQCNYTDGERNNKKITPNKPKMLLLTDFFCSFLKQQVSQHNRIFPDGHKEQLDGFLNRTLLTWNNTTRRSKFSHRIRFINLKLFILRSDNFELLHLY